MVKKVTKKTSTEKKVSAKSKAVEVEPFAEIAEPAPIKKRAKSEPGAIATGSAKKSATKAPKKPSKTIISDPFAEIAEPSSPVKKRVSEPDLSSPPYEGGVAAASADGVVFSQPKARKSAKPKKTAKPNLDITTTLAAAEPKVELSPTFKALADVSLPELKRENRARLQMQSPTRAYFYWSVREDPWHTLRSVFGDDLGSYTLVLKLVDLKHGREEIRQTDAEGNYWFDVEPDGSYQAEIGFYAPNRPYFRILYSNVVDTPRRSPSPHAASEAKWTVSATKFAEVLDVAGFARDAFDVAVAGDDHAAAENTTHIAFASFMGTSDYQLHGIAAEDIRYAMMALASGLTLEELRWRVSPSLFAILQANTEKLSAPEAMNALTEHFDIDEAEFTEEYAAAPVYGASVVHFPKTLKTRTLSPRYKPVSSLSLR